MEKNPSSAAWFSKDQLKKYGIWQSALLALTFLLIYYALEFGVSAHFDTTLPPPWRRYLPLLEKLSIALFTITTIFLVGRVVERIIDTTSDIEGIRYNLVRMTRLITLVLVAIVTVSFLFQNLYAAAVSFGLISLVLGFALQAPITSFIAWLYIVFRRPYHVGDRIQLGDLRGDVIGIGYLDTTIQECSGIYLANDRHSGRIIHFPNSIILKAEVINYSGPYKPFIWNETAIQIAYTSNLEFVETCLLKAADEDFQERYPHRLHTRSTAAAVYFRVNSFAWLEAVISYPVEPQDTTGRRNRILRGALPMLNREPKKVQFPDGTKR